MTFTRLFLNKQFTLTRSPFNPVCPIWPLSPFGPGKPRSPWRPIGPGCPASPLGPGAPGLPIAPSWDPNNDSWNVLYDTVRNRNYE